LPPISKNFTPNTYTPEREKDSSSEDRDGRWGDWRDGSVTEPLYVD
jgi:hypothetical protein